MKASKFSDAQKAFILKQGADGVPVAEEMPCLPDRRVVLKEDRERITMESDRAGAASLSTNAAWPRLTVGGGQ